MKRPLLALCPALLFAVRLPAQDIVVDENVLFGDTISITDSARVAAPSRSGDSAGSDRKSVGFSGNVIAVSQGAVTRDYFGSPDVEESSLANAVVGNAALDVRLLRNYKAFAELEWSFSPSGAALAADSGTDFRVPEMFLDANIRRRAYFRVGKQVLQWGRNAFFNPTDLINVERRTFFRRIGSREGVYGAKAHVPFGTAWNLYGFLDGHGVDRPDSVAGAFRAERLLGRTEMSAMIWGRAGAPPVYGADVSTRLFGLNLTGEAALYQAFEAPVLDLTGSFPAVVERREEWAPRVAFGLGRSFRVSGVKDRLNVVGEYYYNGPGNDRRTLGLAPFLATVPGDGLPGSGISGLEQSSLLVNSGFYEPNSYSKHYAAFFTTFDRFLRRNLTLVFNAIGNLNQRCALLSGGITYQDLNDFSLSFTVNGFAGPDDTEYTLAGQAVQAQIIAEAAF